MQQSDKIIGAEKLQHTCKRFFHSQNILRLEYGIADIFLGVRICDLDENFPYENLGVVYWNACNTVHVTKQTNFIPRKLPDIRNI